jgi:2-methylisocitrate lyase-like PEP mutase family enzyme
MTMDHQRLIEYAERLRALHLAPEVLVLPNCWDVGTAKLFAQAGFPAIATTSSGVEFSEALSLNLAERREQMLAVIRKITSAVSVPVTADIETGYAGDPRGLQDTVRSVIEAGVVGVNLEDTVYGLEVALRFGQNAGQWPIDEAAERIRAARQAANGTGVPLVINARTDAFILQRPAAIALEESITRGNAYLEAGADCVFVPQANDCATIAALVAGIRGPINILGGPQSPSISELQELGVARVSIGGSLARAAMKFVKDAVEELRDRGTFSYAEQALSYNEIVEILNQ